MIYDGPRERARVRKKVSLGIPCHCRSVRSPHHLYDSLHLEPSARRHRPPSQLASRASFDL
eukprot:3165401-Prymnesium_polylepis.1